MTASHRLPIVRSASTALALPSPETGRQQSETSQAKDPRVIIYTTPTCPDCHALKIWLTNHGIAFEERDLSDPAIAEEAKARTGVRVAPVTLVGDKVFYGTFAAQKPELAELLGLQQARSGTSQ